MPARQAYLLAYDISCPKRQAQVRRILQTYAVGRQKSVFECLLSPPEYAHLHLRLSHLLKPEDTFHIISLGKHPALLFGLAEPMSCNTLIIG